MKRRIIIGGLGKEDLERRTRIGGLGQEDMVMKTLRAEL